MKNFKSETIYFPGLNGLRAIAAIAVVISHITLNLKEFNLDLGIFSILGDGKTHGLSLAKNGVSIFFVLSGFLITYLLQAEKDVQIINVKKFYVRRILRIWPLYYLYLLICIGIILVFKLNLNIQSLFFYVFYTANVPFILGSALPLLAHYWSLGVEEQFYLFWPWFNKKINKNIISVIIFLIILLLGTKLFCHFFYPGSLLEEVIHVTRFHAMMIGALGAILYKQNNTLLLKITDNKITQSICWFIIFLFAINKFHIASVIDNEIICAVTLCLIIGQIKVRNRIINLETNTFDFLGKVSYGIYVIHPILIFLFAKIIGQWDIQVHFKFFMVYVIILGSTIFLSHISYTYFEKYFLNLKKKFVVVQSSASKVL